ncbi:hypothetical protein PILCRDRAFT_825376 [Piloderma croceum F 1598]|uniref:Ubiquitin-like protease family profile domain-containing protein n=1 Tax=Piloderma croceum (strain F 1598) TaxID=765440 RepID=A0A0C3FC01_PILCF|nr:hypothetical protein PILCRDRAFT_825376 [Piloderma croceum F 1598]
MHILPLCFEHWLMLFKVHEYMKRFPEKASFPDTVKCFVDFVRAQNEKNLVTEK